jgi:hypothetical protein
MDILVLLIFVLFFGLTFGLVRLCERLQDPRPGGDR